MMSNSKFKLNNYLQHNMYEYLTLFYRKSNKISNRINDLSLQYTLTGPVN